MIKNIVKPLLIFLFAFFLISCSSVKKIQSFYDNKIVIDGQQNEWDGKLNLDEKQKLAVGFSNNDENFYICIVTSDRSNIMKILRLGMTIWFEPTAGGKIIGVKFPITQHESLQDLPFASRSGEFEQMNPDERYKKLIESQKEISIVNEDEYPLYLLEANDEVNFNAKIGFNKGLFVYELKVPLSTNELAKYFVESKPGEKIRIGITTNEFKMEAPMQRSGGGMNPGGGQQPGGGMGGGRRGGGMQGGNRLQEMNFDLIKLWYEVDLMASRN